MARQFPDKIRKDMWCVSLPRTAEKSRSNGWWQIKYGGLASHELRNQTNFCNTKPQCSLSDLESFDNCTICDRGWYCDAPGLLQARAPCDPGYVCYAGATTSGPIDGVTGELCLAGGYCPVGKYCCHITSGKIFWNGTLSSVEYVE
jgi:hypothetical protein